MDEGGTTSKTGIYCRGCGYDLRESSTRCPECGRAFDRGDRRTFDRVPYSVRIRRFMKAVALLLLLVTLPSALGLGWLWWGWKAEQEDIAALEKAGWIVEEKRLPGWVPELDDWVKDYLPERISFVGYRAGTVWHPRHRLAEEDIGRIARLTHIREMRIMSVNNPPPMDRYAAALGRLKGLEKLDVAGAQLTDAGLKHVAGMTRMRHLRLGFTKVTDAGLAHLAGMADLMTLDLSGTAITDAGLQHLRSLHNLRALDVTSTHVTPAGTERLRMNLPELKILQVLWINILMPPPPLPAADGGR